MNNGYYGLVFVGVVVYYIKNAHSFADGVVGFLKALVWPAVVAYKVFQQMHW